MKNQIKYRTFISYVIIFVSTCLSNSCKVETLKDKGYDTRAIAQGIDDRKVKRVTANQLLQWVETTSDTMFAPICEQEFEKKLSSTKKTDKNITWQEFYKNENFKKRDSLIKRYEIRIALLDLNDTTALQKLSGKEKLVLEAYQYEFLKNKTLAKNLQKLDKEANEMLVCVPAVVSGKYNLSGWSLKKDDILGIWAIYITKKEAIRHINMKQLLKNTQK